MQTSAIENCRSACSLPGMSRLHMPWQLHSRLFCVDDVALLLEPAEDVPQLHDSTLTFWIANGPSISVLHDGGGGTLGTHRKSPRVPLQRYWSRFTAQPVFHISEKIFQIFNFAGRKFCAAAHVLKSKLQTCSPVSIWLWDLGPSHGYFWPAFDPTSAAA